MSIPEELPHAIEPVVARVAEALRQLDRQPLAPGLYLVATPIGNLADLTLRAVHILLRADHLYCEDTRHSRTLLAHYGINRPARPYHEHNAEHERPRILADLAAGKSIALVSDAGTPLVSDPGFKLVRAAAAAGHVVTAAPGPSALTTALAVAGVPTDTVLFAGFLPPRSAARRTRLEELKAAPGSLVVFEAAQRLAETLADMHAVLGDREAVVARELTKLHEEVRRDRLAALGAWAAAAAVRGEIVLLVAPSAARAPEAAEIEARLADLLAEMSVRDAAKVAAETFGIPKARAYDLALGLKRRAHGGRDPDVP